MSQLVFSGSFECLCYGATVIINILFLSVSYLLVSYMLESDVHRRQILTYKDGPCTERVKVLMMYMGAFSIFICKI